MCGKMELFSDLDENFREIVKLGNNSSIIMKGKYTIRFLLNEISQIITGVFIFFVPIQKNNLLKIG